MVPPADLFDFFVEWFSYNPIAEENEEEGYAEFEEEDVVLRESEDDAHFLSDTEQETSLAPHPHVPTDDLYFSILPEATASVYSFRPTSRKISSLVHSLFPALSIRVDDVESREAKKSVPNTLRLTIFSAWGLAKSDILGLSDPRCDVYWMGELVFQTKCLKNTLNPEWNDSFDLRLDVDDILLSDLRIEVIDLDLGVSSDFLGQIIVTGDEILDCISGPKVLSSLIVLISPDFNSRATTKFKP